MNTTEPEDIPVEQPFVVRSFNLGLMIDVTCIGEVTGAMDDELWEAEQAKINKQANG